MSNIQQFTSEQEEQDPWNFPVILLWLSEDMIEVFKGFPCSVVELTYSSSYSSAFSCSWSCALKVKISCSNEDCCFLQGQKLFFCWRRFWPKTIIYIFNNKSEVITVLHLRSPLTYFWELYNFQRVMHCLSI